jgi:hypothetical protein
MKAIDRASILFCLFALVACLDSCTTGQRKDARTALHALDLVCDTLEVSDVSGTATIACELTDEVRDAALEVLKPKKRKKTPKPVASDGGAP